MYEEEIMAQWYKGGGIVVVDDALVLTLHVLVKNNVKDYFLRYLGGTGWGIAPMY